MKRLPKLDLKLLILYPEPLKITIKEYLTTLTTEVQMHQPNHSMLKSKLLEHNTEE